MQMIVTECFDDIIKEKHYKDMINGDVRGLNNGN